MSDTPIGDHALLSDCHSAALVDKDGSVEWLTFPRFDSPSVFGRLLDVAAGHWAIRPTGEYRVSRRYVEDTMVLETTFRTPSGSMVLTDALAMGPGNTGHALGTAVPHLLLRQVHCPDGEVELEISYAPRPEYGLAAPLLANVERGVTARAGAERLVLTCPVPLRISSGTGVARRTLRTGETLRFGLHRSTLEQKHARTWQDQELADELEATVHAWRSWSALHQSYDGPWRDLVQTSGRVLQALTFRPTGAIVAAATTSLPEGAGGGRNWDYRYCWVRDASLTMEALWVAACPDEARDFFAFMATAAGSSVGAGQALQIMFGVGAEHDLTERTLPHLAGWRNSRPVRVGNDAWRQEQLDVYGELVGACYRFSDRVRDFDVDTHRFIVALADAATVRWRQTDRGIWEVRGEPQHFVHSKVMCWVALDRAISLADQIGAEHRVSVWQRVRGQIHEEVLRHGWSDSAGAFTQSFGSETLDASALTMAIVGFLPATDPRMLSTIETVAAELTDERGLVYRYRTDAGVDGLAGDEGTFLLCTFWLAQALALADRLERARAVFERAAGYVNDVGLLAEEVDPRSGELLGNFPQAFSHIGLVNAASAIAQAERRATSAQVPPSRDAGCPRPASPQGDRSPARLGLREG